MKSNIFYVLTLIIVCFNHVYSYYTTNEWGDVNNGPDRIIKTKFILKRPLMNPHISINDTFTYPHVRFRFLNKIFQD